MNPSVHAGTRLLRGILVLLAAAASGCGTTLSRSATEQLLLSSAVDRSVSQIDFTQLSGEKVYLDTRYITPNKNGSLVNTEYIVSSLRQQMTAARCLLQDKIEDSDYVVEARVGALATDGHEIIYGLPANNLLSTAANLLPTAPPIPSIPEISVGKKQDQSGAVKVAVFAYDRETREAVWQSGVSQARSHAKDTWFLGAGPFQDGSIYDGKQFAGNKVRLPLLSGRRSKPARREKRSLVGYGDEFYFGKSSGIRQRSVIINDLKPLNPADAPSVASAAEKPAVPLARSETPAGQGASAATGRGGDPTAPSAASAGEQPAGAFKNDFELFWNSRSISIP